MTRQSAGLLVYMVVNGECRVLLVHPGGPLYGHKDDWSIPKGELDGGEDHSAAAYREFREEVGVPAPEGPLIELGSCKRSSGKINYIWAVECAEGDVDLTKFSSNSFTMEWPPRSGRVQEFPENDRVSWFNLSEARAKIFASQIAFIDRLAAYLDNKPAA